MSEVSAKSIARELKRKARPVDPNDSVNNVVKQRNKFISSAFEKMFDPVLNPNSDVRDLTQYTYDIEGYCNDIYEVQLWSGVEDKAGQLEIAKHYINALKQQREKKLYEETGICDYDIWKPGDRIQNWIRVEAGHTVGKTMLAAILVCHFFDVFDDSIIYAFAPSFNQINDLLFKEIRIRRGGRDDLPGKVYKTPRMDMGSGDDDRGHFVTGKATGGGKTERVHGQHAPHMLFVLDEAEGIEDYVWDAVQSMTGGGESIVICLANPKTDSSMFARIKAWGYVRSFRLSCLDHPNVYHGKEIVPGAVLRTYADDMIEKHCDIVKGHDSDKNTFEVHWQPGKIFLPDSEFMFRVMGIAPADRSKNTFCPPARVEAAMRRKPEELDAYWKDEDRLEFASIGIDCARYGNDSGKIYTFHGGVAELYWSIYQQDGMEYFYKARQAILALYDNGARMISVRVDGGGGYGSTVIDNLNAYDEWPEELELIIHEIHFQEQADNPEEYADLITQLYEEAAGMLSYISIIDASDALVMDIAGRTYKWINRQGRPLKRLTNKEEFRRQYKRSPDDGDGLVLCIVPEFLLSGRVSIGFA